MEFAGLAPDTMLARMGVAFLAGALIGMERERHQSPAGLRTHMLVALASALFAMISIVAAGDRSDPGRIAAQVVTGIGFLGAGTIMRHGSTVKGLTTAASLWMAAALGLAAGFGWHLAAAAGALLAFAALTLVKCLESYLPRPEHLLHASVSAHPGADPLPEVMTVVRSLGGVLERVKFGPETLQDGLHASVTIAVPAVCDREALIRALGSVEGVRDVEPE
jgi:putative Mg2+ transporter-C (MgtC) family protein